MKKHMGECDLRPSACQFAALGCKIKIIGGDPTKHNKKYGEKHVKMLEKVLQPARE